MSIVRKSLKTVKSIEVLEGQFKVRNVAGIALTYQVTVTDKEGVKTHEISYVDDAEGFSFSELKKAINEKLADDIKSTRFFILDIEK